MKRRQAVGDGVEKQEKVIRDKCAERGCECRAEHRNKHGQQHGDDDQKDDQLPVTSGLILLKDDVRGLRSEKE